MVKTPNEEILNTIQPINVASCFPGSGTCTNDPCVASGTNICCKDCGNSQHQQDIKSNLDEADAAKIIELVAREHKCNQVCGFCVGKAGLRIFRFT